MYTILYLPLQQNYTQVVNINQHEQLTFILSSRPPWIMKISNISIRPYQVCVKFQNRTQLFTHYQQLLKSAIQCQQPSWIAKIHNILEVLSWSEIIIRTPNYEHYKPSFHATTTTFPRQSQTQRFPVGDNGNFQCSDFFKETSFMILVISYGLYVQRQIVHLTLICPILNVIFFTANLVGWVLEGLRAEFMHIYIFYSKMYISAQMYNFCTETTFLCRSKG